MASRRNVLLALLVVIVGITTVTAGFGWVALSSNVKNPDRPPATERHGDSPSVDSEVVELYEAGVTGENVSVSVLDVTGYDLTRGEFEGRIVETKRFGADAPPVDGGNVRGTAAASIVARIAPGSDIHLATFATPDGYKAALEWMVEEDIDIVVTEVQGESPRLKPWDEADTTLPSRNGLRRRLPSNESTRSSAGPTVRTHHETLDELAV